MGGVMRTSGPKLCALIQAVWDTLVMVFQPARGSAYNREQDEIDRAAILKHFSEGGTVETLEPYLRKRCAYICATGAGSPRA